MAPVRAITIACALYAFAPYALAEERLVSSGDAHCDNHKGRPFCSIQAAIRTAKPDDTIRLQAGRYNENIVIDKSLRLIGASPTQTIIDGRELDSAIRIRPAVSVILENIGIVNGRARNGGGIVNQGNLTVRNCDIRNNIAEHSGGGIYNGGSMSAALVVEHSSISQNSALGDDKYNVKFGGGGVYSDAPLRIHTTVIKDNLATDNGGGVYSVYTHRRDASRAEQLTEQLGIAATPTKQTLLRNVSSERATRFDKLNIETNHARNGGGVYAIGRTDIRNSTISGNRATGSSISSGGGIFAHFSAQLTLANVSVTHNFATFRGGGVRYYSVNPSQFYNTSIIGNETGPRGRGAGLFIQSGSARLALSNSILYQNQNANGMAYNCDGEIASTGYSFIAADARCVYENALGDISNGSNLPLDIGIRFSPDRSSYELTAASPLIDSGNPAGCIGPERVPLVYDINGRPRTVDGDRDGTIRCDIGAVEAPFNATRATSFAK